MTWTTRPRSDRADGIAAIAQGEGPAVVLFHGVGLNADSWGAQIDALSARFAVTALDLPGHGASRPLAEPRSLADFADALIPAIETIGEPVRLAGHSLGALLTLDIAARRPDLCRAIAVLNAIHRRPAEAVAAVQARADAMSPATVNDPSPTLARWFGDDRSSDAFKACERWLTSVDPAAYKTAYTLFAASDSPPDAALAGIACPALFLTGADEPNSTPAMSRALAAAVSDGRAAIVDGAAHMAMMTHADAVNAALLDFFGAVAGGGDDGI